jgi:SMC interacting uncharacterized protein involved in chromosome segregation
MAAQRTSFEKLQRDRNKKAKAALKRERRQGTDGPEVINSVRPEVVDQGGELSASALLELIESIHKQYAAKTITADEFEEKKAELLARLPID